MNIYRREMRANLRSLLFWSIGIAVFILASMTKYSALVADPSSLNIFYQLPLPLQAVFGVGSLDFMKASGFYGMIYPYLLLMAAIHASMLGAVILSKEERDKTTEFLYAKPASRSHIVSAKVAAAVTVVLIFNLMTLVFSVAIVQHYAGAEAVAVTIVRLMAGMLLLQLVFLSLGLASAAVFSRPKAATGIAAGMMIATYLLSIAIEVNGKINWAKVFTPFEYFDAKRIVGSGQGLDLWYVVLCLALTAAFAIATYLRFDKRDLRV